MKHLIHQIKREEASPFTKNGRELQKLLGSTKDHTDWSKAQIERLGLKGSVDYEIRTEMVGTRKNVKKKTYFFTEATALRIASHTQVRSENAIMIKDNFTISRLASQGNEDAILIEAGRIIQGRIEKLKGYLN